MHEKSSYRTEHPHAEPQYIGTHQWTPFRSAAMFDSLFERSGVGMAALNPRGRIRQANDALLALLDQNNSQLHDVEFAELVHPDSRSRLRVGLDQLSRGRTGRFTEYVKVPRSCHGAGGNLTALRVRTDVQCDSSLLVLLQVPPAPAVCQPDGAQSALLGEAEAKILEGLAAGASTVQLASQLYLSCKGVEYHVSAMLRRLGVPNRPALVSRAYAMGILNSGSWPPRVQQAHLR
ncbi:helix-turn-helix transcriptional regulator [Streptomyces paludis]|nr:LuxR C-terminal-related transcriptional regulator [Streptomyces paludis]